MRRLENNAKTLLRMATMCAMLCLAAPAAGQTMFVYGCGNDYYTGQQPMCFLGNPPRPNPQGPKRTIQAAIDAVSDGWTIIVLAGVYNEAINLKGKAIRVQGAGAVLDGSGLGTSVVRCDSGEGPDTILQNLLIRNGHAPNGGGMSIHDSSPTIISCGFIDNSADRNGGAVYCYGSGATFTNCQFLRNTSVQLGGGLFNHFSTLSIEACSFRENISGYGGGLCNANDSDVTITSSVICLNSATNAGGIYNSEAARVELAACVIHDNVAERRGGGVDNFRTDLTLTDCRLIRNMASEGAGGIRILFGATKLVDCEIRGNTASSASGGGLTCQGDADLAIVNSTFVGNAAGTAGGMRFQGSIVPSVVNCVFASNQGGAVSAASDMDVTNSIFWDNVDTGGSAKQISYLPGVDINVTFSCVQGGWPGDGNIDRDPRFRGSPSPGPDGDWGTTDDDYGDLRLGQDSFCIDAGDCTAVPVDVTTDLDGNPRLIDAVYYPDVGLADDGDPVVDMGAYEAEADTPATPRGYILWRHERSGDNWIWTMNGGMNVSPYTVPMPSCNTNWRAVGMGDFNGDGLPFDLVWRHQVTGKNSIWLMDYETVLPESGPLPTVADTDWEIVGVGDFNADGNGDLLWRHRVTGKNSMWLLDAGTVLPDSGPITRLRDTNWAVADVDDFDGDGRSDILWRHGANGKNSMWLMDATTVRPESGPLPQRHDTAWAVAGAGDFNGDGTADILWRHGVTGENSMWLMDGPVLLESAPIQSVGNTHWTVAGTNDFDGDGRCDILWRHTRRDKSSMWLMDGLDIRPRSGPMFPAGEEDGMGWVVAGTSEID